MESPFDNAERSFMNANEVLRIVDSLHREKSIEKEIVFVAIESGLVSAARKHFGEEADIEFFIDRQTGEIAGRNGQEELDYEETIGRIGAQTAKQVIIQKVREAERDSQIEEFSEVVNDIVTGTVHRNESRLTTVTLGAIESILPKGEQIPGDSFQPGERIRALVTEVKAQGSRIKVVLSRTRPMFVQRLFEMEIPEIADGVITVNSISREPGYRSKVAVSSSDSKVDCVGACVGVRGNRIKVIIDELAGERIDIVRWDPDPLVLIPNALQPAEVDEVILCQMMGRAIVLVREDQLSLAIGKRGQNVRLASRLCSWDIEIMTQAELEKQIDRAVQGFCKIDGVSEDLANQLVGEGYLSYDDLSVIEPEDLMRMGELTEEQVDAIVTQAEGMAEQAEHRAAEEKQQRKKAEADKARELEKEKEKEQEQESPEEPSSEGDAV
jgi:transcription termination/antitermination protein NusA